MRNAFETRAAAMLPPSYQYETTRLPYTLPPSHYVPDWYDAASHTVVEAKGRWMDCDRRKLRAVRQQYPALRLIIVFQRPNTPISKRSKTTYAEYARKIGLEVMSLEDLATLRGDA
jgi:hypothetical protein